MGIVINDSPISSWIVLTGFMCSGKSTVAPIIASTLGLICVDLDEEIEHNSEVKIASLIERGIDYFRAEELKAFNLLSSRYQNNKLVLSLGGGALLNSQILEEISTIPYSFYLSASQSILSQRLKASDRPLWNENFSDLMDERIQGYQQMRYTINTNFLTPEAIAKEIVLIVNSEQSYR